MFKSLLAAIFNAVVRVRLWLYKSGLKKTHRLEKPVVSIGNITLGGTGKTPFTIYLCRILESEGHSPAVLSRGYRGTGENSNLLISDGRDILSPPEVSGDEPRLIAESLPGIPVAIGGRRHASARIISGNPALDTSIFVLDDGFQHIQLHRDINLVLVDATSPFGGGKLVPAGILREPLESLSRADALIVTRSHLKPEKREVIREELSHYAPSIPIFFYCHRITGFRPVRPGGNSLKTDGATKGAPPGDKAFLLAAIGNPIQFTRDLEMLNLDIRGKILMRDHHAYDEKDLAGITDEFRLSGADFIVTTEKDAVRLRGLEIDRLPLFAAVQEIYSDEEIRFREWLSDRLTHL